MLTMLVLHQPVGGISRGIVPNIPGYHQQLLQTGFCSERSRKYANSCLFKVNVLSCNTFVRELAN